MVHLYSTLNKLCTELSNKSSYQRNDNAQKDQTTASCGWFHIHHPPLKATLGGFVLDLFTLLAFFYKWSFCSLIRNLESCTSGPKTSWPNSTFHHSPNVYCCFSLPTPMQGWSCPCQPPAAHALFGISISEGTLGSCGPDQMGSAGKAPSVGLWRRRRDARSTLRPPDLLLALDGKGHLHHHLWK